MAAPEGIQGENAYAGEPNARERILAASYDLFRTQGVRAVGVDTVIAEAGVAKMTLYRHFGSKDELALAFLRRREELWTKGWLQAEVQRRGSTPVQQLMAIFELFGEWFARDDYEGCAFVTELLDLVDRDHPVRQACVEHLENIRSFLRELLAEAGVDDADGVARQWHILMKGSIVAAAEGDRFAAMRAREMGMLLLAHHGVETATH